MDPQLFSENLNREAAMFVGKFYDLADLPRTRVQDITNSITRLLNSNSISSLFNLLLNKLKDLGESTNSIRAYEIMFKKLQNPFDELNTEHQCLQYFEKINTYVPPNEVKVGKKTIYKTINGCITPIQDDITVQVVVLRDALKNFFELPGIYEETMTYVNYLEERKTLVTNVIQGTFWKEKKLKFQNKIVLPLYFYQDDFETNNPLGSHRGLGKLGTIYINIPCLPLHLQSKIENIFLLALYKTDDLKHVTLNSMLSATVAELIFLESTGVTISTLSGPKQLHFSLAGVIGDNLAVHSILGFIGSFSAHYPCRFCKTNRANINSVFDETMCLLRTNDNYNRDLESHKSNEMGISGLSVLNDLKSSTTIELLTVDVMHDMLEGTLEYDLGLILNYFITEEKFFTLDEINDRIVSLFYGVDNIGNKPRKIKKTQISDKHIKMSAAEALCFIRNIGVLIGDLIPPDNSHWKLCAMIKDIVDIVTSTVTHDGIIDYLQSLISEYLRLLVTLFPGCMKPKHHLLIHYPRVMRLKGPAWGMNTMRNESMNRYVKTTAATCLSRKNICKTLAIKHQLHMSFRFLMNKSADKSFYECGPFNLEKIENVSHSYSFINILPNNIRDVLKIDYIKCKGRIIQQNAVLMIPSETDPQFYLVHVILESTSHELSLITKDISDYAYYDQHFHAYKVMGDFSTSTNWKSLTNEDLNYCSVTHITVNKTGCQFISKRWI